MTRMKDRLVQDASRILLLLLKGKANVNYIIKETGIYKNRVFKANEFLEKAKLANRSKDTKVHKQKEYIQLNEFGQELANFIENTTKFEKSFEQLKKTIKHIYYMPEDTEKKAIRSLLLGRGLNQQEIDSYRDDLGYAEDFVSDSLSILSEGILNKYALFLLEFDPNSRAEEFLKEVIIHRLSKYLLLRVETIVKEHHLKCEKCGMDLSKQVTARHRIDEMIEENGSRLFNFLEDYVQIPFNNRHIKDEVKGIISCLFSTFHLSRSYIESKLEESIEQCNKVMTSHQVIDETRARNIKSEINYLADLKALA